MSPTNVSLLVYRLKNILVTQTMFPYVSQFARMFPARETFFSQLEMCKQWFKIVVSVNNILWFVRADVSSKNFF